MLNDQEIDYYCKCRGMIRPYDQKYLSGVSYDLGLAKKTFCYYEESSKVIDPTEDEIDFMVLKQWDEPIIYPHEFMLACTVEKLNIPLNVSARVVGKSSIGRLGLFVQNADHIDPGFKGNIILELYNASPFPINLRNIDRICQIEFTRIKQPRLNNYKSKYQSQDDTTPSKIKQEYE